MRSSGSSTYHINKLTEINYRSWAQQVKWILDERDLWELVIGVEPMPGTVSVVTSEDYDQKLAAWNKKAKKARSIIGSSITASVMTYIEGLDNPVEMWRTLAEKYDPKSQTTLLQVVREFMIAHMDENTETMEQHLQKVQRLKRQVEEQGEKVSTLIYNGILLNSVSDSYKITTSILEAQPDLKPEMIINRLLEENRKSIGSGVQSGIKIALMSHAGKSSVNPSKKAGRSKSGIKCSHCNRDGHTEDRCFLKHPEMRPKNGRGKKSLSGRYAMAAKKFEQATVSLSTTPKRTPRNQDHWYLDSGATEHFSPYRDLFANYKELPIPCEIITAKGTMLKGVGTGTIWVNVTADNKVMDIPITDVIYAPDMDSNLLSTTTLYDKGFEISMKPGVGVNILKDKILVSNTTREGRLFRLKTVSHAKVTVSASKEESVQLWHMRMGHLGEANVRKLETMAEGVAIAEDTSLGVCRSCQEGKQTRQPSHTPAKREKEPLDLIHSDLCGPIDPMSVGGANYFGLFIDDATRMTCIVPLKTKESRELLERFSEYQAQVEKQLGRKIKRIRTDGGGEYLKHFERHLKAHGIIHETTAPYSAEQNGVSERANRTILERTKAILAETKLPKELWMEIASTVVHLKNRSPTTALEGKTPFEAWFGEKPNLSHLRSIGCMSHVHVPKEKRKKLDSHSRSCKLVGYAGTNQYRLWDPAKRDVVISRDVVFNEDPPEIIIINDTPAQPIQEAVGEQDKVVNAEEFISEEQESVARDNDELEHVRGREI